MSPAAKKYTVNPDILCEKEADGMLLFDSHSGEVKILNETGAFVYGLLQKGNDLETVVARLTEEFDIESAVADSDVNELVAQLEASRLIHILQESC